MPRYRFDELGDGHDASRSIVCSRDRAGRRGARGRAFPCWGPKSSRGGPGERHQLQINHTKSCLGEAAFVRVQRGRTRRTTYASKAGWPVRSERPAAQIHWCRASRTTCPLTFSVKRNACRAKSSIRLNGGFVTIAETPSGRLVAEKKSREPIRSWRGAMSVSTRTGQPLSLSRSVRLPSP